jgi:uncharacterized protein (TIGR03067 family)
MQWQLVMVLAAGLVTGADKPQGGPASQDRAPLQGTWTLVSLETGVSLASLLSWDDLTGARLMVRGDRYDCRLGKLGLEAAYTIAPRQPKAIDLAVTSGPDKGKVIRAAYEVRGDTLRICYRQQQGAERPATCRVRPAGETVIITWQRLHR